MASFRKRNVKSTVPGTRTSPQTGQRQTSSGNPSLDVILGGGMPIGSICLIEEDKFVTHSKVLAKYFLAEGIVSRQAVFLGSLDDEPAEFLRRLPKALDEDELEKEQKSESDDGEDLPQNGLRIAWRYNDLPLVNSEQSSIKIGHQFNLLEQIESVLLDFADTAIWNDTQSANVEGTGGGEETDDGEGDNYGTESDAAANSSDSSKDIDMENAKCESDRPEAMELDAPKSEESAKSTGTVESTSAATTTISQKPKLFENEKYKRILSEIHPFVREDKYTVGSLGQRGLCRVCITSLGSPLWYDEHFAKDILKFLTTLRAIVRSATCVCLITMPMHLVAKSDETLVAKIRNLVDYSIELESFAGSERETNPAFQQYNGLLHLHKITAINTLSAYMPETSDLAFKLRRKKFVIEKLHLPPELQDNNSNPVSNDEAMITTCNATNVSPNPKAKLDF